MHWFAVPWRLDFELRWVAMGGAEDCHVGVDVRRWEVRSAS
jgi:hypothetical protein